MSDGCCCLKTKGCVWLRLKEAERKAFFVDQRRAHDAEVEELVAQSENQFTHRKAQEGRSEHAESTVRRLGQEVKELESMIKKVGLDQGARNFLRWLMV